MKNLFIIGISYALLFILLSYSVNAQEKIAVQSYIDYLSQFQSYEEFLSNTNSISELKRFARLQYDASEEDAILSYKKLIQKKIESDSLQKINYEKNEKVPSFYSPITVKRTLTEKTYEQFSPLVYCLLWSDYFLRVQINEINIEPQEKVTIPFIVLKATIQEVLKGNSRFKVDESISFYFCPDWRPNNYNFNVGEVCLIPLGVTGFKDGGDKLFLHTGLKDKNKYFETEEICDSCSYGRFPIKNGILIDRDNTFGLGEKLQWNLFNDIIRKQITEIKGW